MIKVLKKNVSYELALNIRNEIIGVKNLIRDILPNCEIYLFGSIAAGRYSKTSDIDILVLINEEKSIKELRAIRHNLEDAIENLPLERKVDIKLYAKERFSELSCSPCFEREIIYDLVDVMGW